MQMEVMGTFGDGDRASGDGMWMGTPATGWGCGWGEESRGWSGWGSFTVPMQLCDLHDQGMSVC